MIRNINLMHIGARRAQYTPPVQSSPSTKQGNKTGDQAPVSFQQVMQSQAPAPAAPAATVVPPAPVAAPVSLHTVAALPNGGLMLNPTGNLLSGGKIAYNPNYYATEEAAQQLAQQVGGAVVDMRGHISNNQAEYFIQLPNGITVNAGNLLAVLNNPAFQVNSRVMDGQLEQFLNNDAVGTPGAGFGRYTVVNGRVSYNPTAQPLIRT